MRRIDCGSCVQRERGKVCDWPDDALGDFRALGSWLLCKPRQVVFNEGGPAGDLYVVCHGAVKLYSSDRFGRDHIHRIAGAGSLLGEMPFDGHRFLSASAESLADTQIHVLPFGELQVFLCRYPETGVRFIEFLAGELAATRRKVRDLALKGAESRLAGLLLELRRADGGGPEDFFQVHCSRREMGEMIGVAAETAIRLLTRLRRRRLVDVRGKEIRITGAGELQRIALRGELEG